MVVLITCTCTWAKFLSVGVAHVDEIFVFQRVGLAHVQMDDTAVLAQLQQSSAQERSRVPGSTRRSGKNLQRIRFA